MPYESSLIGYFTVWQGPENDACDRLNIQKRNEVLIDGAMTVFIGIVSLTTVSSGQ